jgi:VIT1/CCC1 family predicted Fe2+/Mn2+ transporter
VSVASQRELAEAEIDIERRELERNPQSEEDELAQLYVQRGVELETAREVARQISRNPEQALVVHTRAEIGVDPQDLPSPVIAAASSFVSFGVGALIPLVPYLLGMSVLWVPAVASMVALFGAGALVSRVTARSWWFSGLRQLLVGGLAASLTWGLGTLIGAGGS